MYCLLSDYFTVQIMPWEETKEYIRSGHEIIDMYDKNSIRTITIDEGKGIKALVGCPKG